MSATTTAVVIVSHNSGEDIIRCLDSVAAEGPARVVVVDNASTDGTAERIAQVHPEVELIRSDVNLGFAAGANRGVWQVREECVVLLNPDAHLMPGALQALEESLGSHPNAAAVGALVLNPDGTPQPTKRAFPGLWQAALHAVVGPFWPGNPGTRAYVLADEPFAEAQMVDWVAATAVALRRSAFEELGGFDEDFFFFVEDVDLCRRLWDAGFEVWFDPAAQIIHEWGGSWTKRPLRFLFLHQRNVFRYVRKHRRGAWVLAYPLIALVLAARFGLLAMRWLITKRSVPSHRSTSQGRPS